MPLHPWPHMLRRLKKNTPLLGLDVGSKTIGLAISDPARRIASPLTTLMRSKVLLDIQALAALAKERGVNGIVIGLPVHMDGTPSATTKKVQNFAKQILINAALFEQEPHIAFVDERLSTATAQDRLIDDLAPNRRRRDTLIDAMAAQIILENALRVMRLSNYPDTKDV